MNYLIPNTLRLAIASAAISISAYAVKPTAGYVDFGKFSPSASGREFVEVHVTSSIISMAARLTQKSEPDVAELLRGLQLIQVNVIGLDDKNRADVEKRVKEIRAELDAKGWERVVTVQQKNEDVGIYIKTRGEEAVEGLVVTVLDGKGEAVLINIVGDIKPEKLALVGERLNIDPLKKFGPALKKQAAADQK